MQILTSVVLRAALSESSPWHKWILIAALDLLHGRTPELLKVKSFQLLIGLDNFHSIENSQISGHGVQKLPLNLLLENDEKFENLHKNIVGEKFDITTSYNQEFLPDEKNNRLDTGIPEENDLDCAKRKTDDQLHSTLNTLPTDDSANSHLPLISASENDLSNITENNDLHNIVPSMQQTNIVHMISNSHLHEEPELDINCSLSKSLPTPANENSTVAEQDTHYDPNLLSNQTISLPSLPLTDGLELSRSKSEADLKHDLPFSVLPTAASSPKSSLEKVSSIEKTIIIQGQHSSPRDGSNLLPGYEGGTAISGTKINSSSKCSTLSISSELCDSTHSASKTAADHFSNCNRPTRNWRKATLSQSWKISNGKCPFTKNVKVVLKRLDVEVLADILKSITTPYPQISDSNSLYESSIKSTKVPSSEDLTSSFRYSHSCHRSSRSHSSLSLRRSHSRSSHESLSPNFSPNSHHLTSHNSLASPSSSDRGISSMSLAVSNVTISNEEEKSTIDHVVSKLISPISSSSTGQKLHWSNSSQASNSPPEGVNLNKNSDDHHHSTSNLISSGKTSLSCDKTVGKSPISGSNEEPQKPCNKPFFNTVNNSCASDHDDEPASRSFKHPTPNSTSFESMSVFMNSMNSLLTESEPRIAISELSTEKIDTSTAKETLPVDDFVENQSFHQDEQGYDNTFKLDAADQVNLLDDTDNRKRHCWTPSLWKVSTQKDSSTQVEKFTSDVAIQARPKVRHRWIQTKKRQLSRETQTSNFDFEALQLYDNTSYSGNKVIMHMFGTTSNKETQTLVKNTANIGVQTLLRRRKIWKLRRVEGVSSPVPRFITPEQNGELLYYGRPLVMCDEAIHIIPLETVIGGCTRDPRVQ